VDLVETPAEEERNGSALAWAALALYDVGYCTITPIHAMKNATFQVHADSGDRYCLRVQSPQGGEPAELRSELLWLAALRTEAGLVVVAPVPTRAGDLLGTVRQEGDLAARSCVLFRAVEGRPLGDAGLTTATFKRMCAATGSLHAYAEWWRPPSRFQRERLDVGVMGSPRFVGGGLAGGFFLIDSGDDEVLWSAVRQVLAAMRELGEGREVFGIVHGDPAASNWLLYEDEVRLTGFDQCAWSYYLYDLALTLRSTEDSPEYPDLRAALLEGYRSVRRLSSQHEAYLETFLIMADLVRVVSVLRNANHPTFRDWAPEFVRRSLTTLRIRTASV